jgi:hypothetical protein
MTLDDILYSAQDYSPIYVSKSDASSIEKLKSELENDKRYSKRLTSGITIRERLASKVICLDCNNHDCNSGNIPLWFDKPVEIKCNACKFVYYLNSSKPN